jgi:hypothetical protein
MLKQLELPDDEYSDYLRAGVADFEHSAKKAFESADSQHRIKLGGRLTRSDMEIRRGTITIAGCASSQAVVLYVLTSSIHSRSIIQSFFDKWVDETVASIRQQMSGLTPKGSSASMSSIECLGPNFAP